MACKERGENLDRLFALAEKRSTSFSDKVINNTNGEYKDDDNHLGFNNKQGKQMKHFPFKRVSKLSSYPESMEPMLSHEKNHKSTSIQIVPMDQLNRSSNKKYQKPKAVQYPTSTWLQFYVLLKRIFLCTCIRDLVSIFKLFCKKVKRVNRYYLSFSTWLKLGS